jgi:DUF4097 and DUF4098 domain-containing protein YvlB
VLLAAAVLVAGLAGSGCGLVIAHEEARDQWTREYPLAAGGAFELRSTNGHVRVEAAETETVHVTAERIVKASTKEAAERELADFQIRETISADRVALDSSHRGLNIGLSREVNYVVRLPRSASVRIDNTNGRIEVRGIGGELRIASTNGMIQATDLGNGATVETTNGAISLAFAALGAQGVQCETTNGAITVELPPDADADLRARVTNGSISASDFGERLSVTEDSRRRLDARLGQGGTAIRLDTTNGAIRVRGR